MKKIFVISVVLVLILNVLAACKDNSKQYFEDDYNNYVSNGENSDAISSENSTPSNNSQQKP